MMIGSCRHISSHVVEGNAFYSVQTARADIHRLRSEFLEERKHERCKHPIFDMKKTEVVVEEQKCRTSMKFIQVS